MTDQEPIGEIDADEFREAQNDPQVRRLLRDADELHRTHEPSGEAVGALRDALREVAGVEVAAGAARACLVIALVAEYEHRRQERPSRNPLDPREDSAR